jgi:hypothetical protein
LLGISEKVRVSRSKETPESATSRAHKVTRVLRAAIWVTAIVILVALPLRIINFGFLPPDDALRHCAKVISGKSWQEIIVMRPEVTIDHNPGWHILLGWVHQLTGWNARSLVQFSVVSMFILFALSPLPWLRRPETWVAALTLVMLVFPYFAERSFVGRPLFVTMAATIILLLLWTRQPQAKIPKGTLIVSVLLMAISTWVHGSWYLLLLLPFSFLLARLWRKAIVLGLCWAVGTLLGAMLTGEPWTWLHQSALIPFWALGQNAPIDSLVGEFQPFSGGYPALIVVGAVFVWRKLTNRSFAPIGRDPVFWLAVTGWVLGFRVLRFWLDWGLPALALWLAFQFQELIEPKEPRTEPAGKGIAARFAILGGAALLLLGSVASDRGGRWSQYADINALDASRPENAGWAPDPGGILYNVSLSVFYKTFFTNPHGDWRYILGFEPSFMLPEDLAVYQELWRTKNAIHACAPWVAKMKPADRLILTGGPQIRPAFPQLEWRYAAENTWVGRLPRKHSGS